MKLYFTISFLLIFTVGVSQNNWTLIYENDAEGNAVYGNLEELILAIQQGEVVRIYYNSKKDQSTHYVEHSTTVRFCTIMNSPKGKFVAAQIDPITGQIPDFEEETVLLKENLEWSMIATTNGKNNTITRNTISGEILNNQIRHWGTKWFIKMK